MLCIPASRVILFSSSESRVLLLTISVLRGFPGISTDSELRFFLFHAYIINYLCVCLCPYLVSRVFPLGMSGLEFRVFFLVWSFECLGLVFGFFFFLSLFQFSFGTGRCDD